MSMEEKMMMESMKQQPKETIEELEKRIDEIEKKRKLLPSDPVRLFDGMNDNVLKYEYIPGKGFDDDKEAPPEQIKKALDEEFSRLKKIHEGRNKGTSTPEEEERDELVIKTAYETLTNRYLGGGETEEQQEFWKKIREEREKLNDLVSELNVKIDKIEQEKASRPVPESEPVRRQDAYFEAQHRKRPSGKGRQFQKALEQYINNRGKKR